MLDVAAGLDALRHGGGAVHVARDAVLVSGADAVSFLQGQLSQDVAALPVGASAYSFLLQPQGKVDAWLRVSRLAPDAVALDLDAGFADAVIARLQRFKLRTDARIEPLRWRAVAVRGAAPRPSEGGASVVVDAAWPGAAGYDLLGPEVDVPDGLPECDPAALEVLRIECGVPRLGAELDERTIPAEAGRWVVEASVSFSKGCFTGQELVARIDSRGGNVPRRLRGLRLDGSQAVQTGSAVVVGGDEVGAVTSSASTGDGGAVALAYVARRIEVPADAEVRSSGDRVRARVEELPLVG